MDEVVVNLPMRDEIVARGAAAMLRERERKKSEINRIT